MKFRVLWIASLVFAATAGQAHAAFVVSTNQADFNLTSVQFDPVVNGVITDIVSTDTSVKLARAMVGDPITTKHYYAQWTGYLAGNEYALDGDENFDIIFDAPQSAFAMNYLDPEFASTFTLTFFSGATNLGTTSFTTSPSEDTVRFIGFISSLNFDKVTVREDDGSTNSDEYFQFYKATPAAAVPEPASLAMWGAGVFGAFMVRRRRQKPGQTD